MVYWRMLLVRWFVNQSKFSRGLSATETSTRSGSSLWTLCWMTTDCWRCRPGREFSLVQTWTFCLSRTTWAVRLLPLSPAWEWSFWGKKKKKKKKREDALCIWGQFNKEIQMYFTSRTLVFTNSHQFESTKSLYKFPLEACNLYLQCYSIGFNQL